MSKSSRPTIRTSVFLLLGLIGVAIVPLGAAARFADYRGVTLGDSVATVVARLHAEPSSVRVLHEQPSLIEELTWRPSRFISGKTVTPDALAEMVLTFHLGQLVRIAATYDRERTQGLTDADLNELVSGVYGLSMLPSAALSPAAAAEGRRTVGSWRDANTSIQLWSEDRPRRAGLTVTSLIGAAVLDEAAAVAARRDAEESPKREQARLVAAAAAIVARDAKIRLDNKAKFKP